MRNKQSEAFVELGYTNKIKSEDGFEEQLIRIKYTLPIKQKKSKLPMPTFEQHMEALKQ